jgi:hypothetical protein
MKSKKEIQAAVATRLQEIMGVYRPLLPDWVEVHFYPDRGTWDCVSLNLFVEAADPGDVGRDVHDLTIKQVRTVHKLLHHLKREFPGGDGEVFVPGDYLSGGYLDWGSILKFSTVALHTKEQFAQRICDWLGVQEEVVPTMTSNVHAQDKQAEYPYHMGRQMQHLCVPTKLVNLPDSECLELLQEFAEYERDDAQLCFFSDGRDKNRCVFVPNNGTHGYLVYSSDFWVIDIGSTAQLDDAILDYLIRKGDLARHIFDDDFLTANLDLKNSTFNIDRSPRNGYYFTSLTTRAHGNVGWDEASHIDVEEARRLGKIWKDNGPEFKARIETVDEWVMLDLGVDLNKGLAKVFLSRKELQHV